MQRTITVRGRRNRGGRWRAPNARAAPRKSLARARRRRFFARRACRRGQLHYSVDVGLGRGPPRAVACVAARHGAVRFCGAAACGCRRRRPSSPFVRLALGGRVAGRIHQSGPRQCVRPLVFTRGNAFHRRRRRVRVRCRPSRPARAHLGNSGPARRRA
ncbi:predicted protein [Clavispora lusitaniae ATCC 42720]|uniref:Uncharacterized protein n=1 Tax=Clavispora lusitaniae (strain ATCC 42720) TaxID=306902 RepID=C4Y8B2_CLAL4|nr:uncharacterized protein CLUG_04440 [Clavispora lusitaniae ATCC 42720]EEQ40311.1 predicted protein [Clavispora lusitaniae ATCC 42720]